MSEWQSIGTAPHDVAVWIYCDDGMRHIAVLESFWCWKRLRFVGKWVCHWPEATTEKNASHWTPLPEVPSLQECARGEASEAVTDFSADDEQKVVR